jgi:uncharacterized protein YegP (UPF0339 family)
MYFEIHKNNALRQYWWVVKAANHQTLATSEMYTTKQGCRNAIEVIATQSSGKSVYDKTGEI